MLPDYPVLRHELDQWFVYVLRMKVNERLGPFAESPSFKTPEGHGRVFRRPDGSIDSTIAETFEATSALSGDEVQALNMDKVMQRLDSIADQMAAQMRSHAFALLDEALHRAGQVTDAKGRSLTADLILDALEAVHIEFDRNRKPSIPTLVIPPHLGKAARQAYEHMLSDPILRKRLRDVIDRKYDEWCVREDSRTLVG